MRNWFKLWLGSCLVGVTAAGGCSHTLTRPTGDAPAAAARVAQGPVVAGSPLAYQTRTAPAYAARPPASPYGAMPAVAAAPRPAEYRLPPAPDRQAERPVIPAAYTEAPRPASAPDPLPIQQTPAVPELERKIGTSPRGEGPPQRKSYVDLTAAPCFGHLPDYSQLSGQVEYSRLKGWRLRYASVDEADKYGGSVTLVENANLDRLKDGQYVVVQGHFSNPDESPTSPPYRVDSFRVIDNPNSPEQSVSPK